jgi:hypothetical protein
LRTLQDPAHCISPNRLAKQMDKAKVTKHWTCSLTFSLMRLRDLNFFNVYLLPITKWCKVCIFIRFTGKISIVYPFTSFKSYSIFW